MVILSRKDIAQMITDTDHEAAPLRSHLDAVLNKPSRFDKVSLAANVTGMSLRDQLITRIGRNGMLHEDTSTGTFSVAGDIVFRHWYGGQLPSELVEVRGMLDLGQSTIHTLKVFPNCVTKLSLLACRSITSLDFSGPVTISEYIDMSASGVKSMPNIHKVLRGVRVISAGVCKFEGPILGLILVKTLEKISLDDKNLEGILNKHLISRDVNLCQDELVEAGYEKLASLA